MKTMDEIKNKLEEYYAAFRNKNWGAFSSFLTNDFSYYSDNMTIMNKEKFISFLKRDSYICKNISFNELKICSSETLAAAVYKITFDGKMGDKELEVNAAETTLLIKEDNEWKIIHSHVSNKS